TITNSRTPETVDVSGTKTWNDANNQDGKRPTSIKINLLKNGTKINSQTVTDDGSGNWTWTFAGLDKYENGTLIPYSITEEAISEYSTQVNGYDVTNSYTPGKTSVQVTKSWQDNNDQYGYRPTSVTIKLLADGVDTGQTITLNAGNNWTDTFTNLDEYKAGQKIVYTVQEVPLGIVGYSTSISGGMTTGYVVTNTFKPIIVDPPVSKQIAGSTPTVSNSFTFIMKADNPAHPMPSGSVGGVKEITIVGAGTVDFGTFAITVPGTYKYTIYERQDVIPGYTMDTEVYTITHVVTVDAQNQLVCNTTIVNTAGEQKNNAIFVNEYTNTGGGIGGPGSPDSPPGNNPEVKITCADSGMVWSEDKQMCVYPYNPPYTATNNSLFLWISLMISSTILLIINLFKYREI
ncbi:MAG: Cna B-type domain-containing protein, partial [Erysipelotrichaceae bacterium]